MLFQSAVYSGIKLCPVAQSLQPLRLATNNLNQYKVPRMNPLRICKKCLVNPCIRFVTVGLQVVTMIVQNPMDGFPKLIDLYLSQLLHTCKIHNRSSKCIMMLPFTIFCEFEEINDNKSDQCATSLYDDLVTKQKRDIFDTSLVFIFIYREFCWSLAVLVDFDKGSNDSNKKTDLRIAIKNTRLIHVKKRMTKKITGRLFFISRYIC